MDSPHPNPRHRVFKIENWRSSISLFPSSHFRSPNKSHVSKRVEPLKGSSDSGQVEGDRIPSGSVNFLEGVRAELILLNDPGQVDTLKIIYALKKSLFLSLFNK